MFVAPDEPSTTEREAEVAGSREGKDGAAEEEQAETAAGAARSAVGGASGAIGADKDGRRSMNAGGSDEAEAREKGDRAWRTGEKTGAPFAGVAEVAVVVGEGVGRGEEAAVVIGRSMTR